MTFLILVSLSRVTKYGITLLRTYANGLRFTRRVIQGRCQEPFGLGRYGLNPTFPKFCSAK